MLNVVASQQPLEKVLSKIGVLPNVSIYKQSNNNKSNSIVLKIDADSMSCYRYILSELQEVIDSLDNVDLLKVSYGETVTVIDCRTFDHTITLYYGG
jgi:nitrate reductase NapAB chaperone NapD